MATPLTKPYAELVRERAQEDPEFGRLIFIRAIKYVSKGDFSRGKATLHSYIDATIGYEKLGKGLGKSPGSLKKFLGDDSSADGSTLVAIIEFLKKAEGIRFKVSCKSAKPGRKSVRKAAPDMVVA